MRTFYYDLLSYFGFSNDEIAANKAHHHMSHNIAEHAGANITLHYHWNDCENDVPKGIVCTFANYMFQKSLVRKVLIPKCECNVINFALKQATTHTQYCFVVCVYS